ncbi:MAG: hypothetical protein KF770_15750, partial [Anaerolineae bacterium]|nr:hypothetical protein [Anaerolineae bacterium]
TVNGRLIGSTFTGADGEFSVLLSTSLADAGAYFVTAATGPIHKTVSLTLDPTLPIRPQDGSGAILEIPAGIAFTEFTYLPLVRR